METTITLRPATAADLDTLLGFEQSIIRTERPFDPTLKKDPINYYDLNKLLADPEASVIVAEQGNQVIASGYIQIHTAKPYLDHEHYGYLGFMYVVPEFRGQGVNAMIIERLVEFARSKNISEIRLEVYEENERAIRAYEKCGFEKHFIEMRCRI